MKSRSAYPWFFFLKIAQISGLLFLLPLLAVLYFQSDLFLRLLPIFTLSYISFLGFFYFATKPLGIILSKVEKFQIDVPFKKTIELLYRQNKWAQIEEALNEADLKLQDQIQRIRQENEKISTILESINDEIIAVDPFESILFYNSNFESTFSQLLPKGEIIPKIWHFFNSEEILSCFREVLRSSKAQSLKAIPVISQRYFDLTVTPMLDDKGKVTGALGVFYDVTDFKLTEKMRVDFVANVSHEIRTPLTSIKGYSQILQSQSDSFPEEMRGFLDKIIHNTERMISLFNDLLNLSVIESKFQLKKEDFSFSSMSESVCASILSNYPTKKIHFDLQINQETVFGDPRLMEQVLLNLVDNACKYSDRDEIKIKIGSEDKGETNLIHVSDNGPGIGEEHLQRIFERFYRVESSRETSRGTGLGLSIVKHIITRHGGKIWAESREKDGTRFLIEIPKI